MTRVRLKATRNRVAVRLAGWCALTLALGVAVFGVFRVLGSDKALGPFEGRLGAQESTVFAPRAERLSPRASVPPALRPAIPSVSVAVGARSGAALDLDPPTPSRPPAEEPNTPSRTPAGNDAPAPEFAASENAAAEPPTSPVPLVDLPDPLRDPPGVPVPVPSLLVPQLPEVPQGPSVAPVALPSVTDLPLPSEPVLP